jgi:hypothetical protein
MADKRIPKKRTKKRKTTLTSVTKSATQVIDEKADNQTYGGMDLSNFKKNLGCG